MIHPLVDSGAAGCEVEAFVVEVVEAVVVESVDVVAKVVKDEGEALGDSREASIPKDVVVVIRDDHRDRAVSEDAVVEFSHSSLRWLIIILYYYTRIYEKVQRYFVYIAFSLV